MCYFCHLLDNNHHLFPDARVMHLKIKVVCVIILSVLRAVVFCCEKIIIVLIMHAHPCSNGSFLISAVLFLSSSIRTLIIV